MASRMRSRQPARGKGACRSGANNLRAGQRVPRGQRLGVEYHTFGLTGRYARMLDDALWRRFDEVIPALAEAAHEAAGRAGL